MNECPTCGDEYERLGQHLAFNEDHRAELSDRQRALCTYLILRGATVRDGSHPRLEVLSTSERWIRDVADALGWMSNTPRVYDTAGDAYDRCCKAHPSVEFDRENFNDIWAVSTVCHPLFDELRDPTDVDSLEPLTLRYVLEETSTWTGLLFGSLHIDLRGWDVAGEHFRSILSNHGVETVEYDGEGYAEDTFTERYHWHDDVVVVPHYEGIDLLESVGLSVSEVAEPIKLR